MQETGLATKKVEFLLNKLEQSNELESLRLIAEFLEYQIIKNPIDPTSDWQLLSHPELDDDSQSLMALYYDETLDANTTVRELRKKYEQVESQKELFRGYDVYLYAFVGKGRILVFKGYDSNRDERLDISKESIEKVSLFADNLLALSKDRITIQEDSFGFGKEVIGLDELFKRELSNLFMLTVQLYRKRIAELITSNKSLETKILTLLPEYEQMTLKKQSLNHKLLNVNFKQAIGSVIDTIVLRVILRRFLESYHGMDTFTKHGGFKDIGLGIREGKMQEVIHVMAEIEHKHITENKLKKVINDETLGQMSLDLFDEITTGVHVKETEITFDEVYQRMRKQFESAYGGDLFSSDISEVVNNVEEEINQIEPDLLLRLLADISEERFNFRYEDLPPEMIQDFYETSMGYSLHYSLDKNGNSVVTYADDLQERKQKGAYYTNQELVDYMVAKTVGKKIDSYQNQLSEAIKKQDSKKIKQLLSDLVTLNVIDITCGGGSFLRGAFRYISSRRDGIVRTIEQIQDDKLYQDLIEKHPYFKNDVKAESLWEKHVLLEMIYGIDIDYKALIISSQTLTLSALNHWKIGSNLPQLIGLTLMQQNALIGPIRPNERKKIFEPYKQEISRMIELRRQVRKESIPSIADEAMEELKQIRLSVQGHLNRDIEGIFDEEVKEALMSQSIEINFPEVFFNDKGEFKEDGGFDITIGNPPWESWKPLADEFFEIYDRSYRQLKRKDKLELQTEIFDNYPEVEEKWNWLQKYYESGSRYFLRHEFYNYQRIKVDGKFTGSDINLYKVSTERNYQILKPNGICSYLIPANMNTDRGATGIREMLFNNTDLHEVASFENRRGIFDNIHRSYKFQVVTFTKGYITKEFKGFFYQLHLDALHQSNKFMNIPIEVAKKLSPKYFAIPEFRDKTEVNLMKKLVQFSPLEDYRRGSWNLRFIREFDMTNDSNLFNIEGKGYPLYEGKDIWQYELNMDNVRYHVDKLIGKKVLTKKELKRIKKVNKTIKNPEVKLHSDYYRIGFRAVASSTNRRSLIATVLPKHVFCGNSLVLSIPYELENINNSIKRLPNYTLDELTVITALLNSYIADFMLRRKISTNVNMSYVYELPIPRLQVGDMYFDEIMNRSARLICTSDEFDEIKNEIGIRDSVYSSEDRQTLQNQIDAYIAHIYGLNRDEFLYVLSTFKSANHADNVEKISQDIIEHYDVLSEGGELSCPK
ncbi:Eco57I restriction-modification methylase domain-containing protein [Aquisalibacillus elongatus]|uniref:site-specific DNA-methyltransferase (adenine-specific) n=1 Tax=Aquisalibacillus elongatus TaxID=485577 RepID=A0A3N5C7S2_9BACI|nr:hypothetical protein [Aquisalibacillus elongatus]RPF54425.1 hypothetical protein EDC24_1624 [Aquisalibacillus elongatus]